MVTVTGIGPNVHTFSSADVNQSSIGRILSMAVAANGTRLYAGSYAGVWRSDDMGHTWRQMIGPLTDSAGPGIFGGTYAPQVMDLAASPVDDNLVLAVANGGKFVTSRDGLYRSVDGGVSWELVLQGSIGQVIFAPDDPMLVYAALGSGIAISNDAGQSWTNVPIFGTVWHVVSGPNEGAGFRRVYAAGPNQIWFSADGGLTWTFDGGSVVIATARANLSAFQRQCQIAAGQSPRSIGPFAGQTADAVGHAAQVLAVEPGNPARVYLAAIGGSFGLSYYHSTPDGTTVNTTCPRLADEGSLWLGDFTQFAATGSAQWQQLPGPPVYFGATSPSGNAFVIAKPTSSGYLLFFSDMSHVHVSAGEPMTNVAWHRLDGQDLSVTAKSGEHRNVLLMHADPHALVFTRDFEITLKPATGVSFPYDQNTELNSYVGGTIWMANDGGVYWSDNGGQTWKQPFGLETLDPVNIAGLYGLGGTPALYFGCGDNDDFFSRDGGATWASPGTGCGDCDTWFGDLAQPDRVLYLVPRVGGLRVIKSSDPSQYPNASDQSQWQTIPPPRRQNGTPYPRSDMVLRGYRPLIHTGANETPLPDGDYIFISQMPDGTASLLRTTSISSIHQVADWGDPTKAQQIGSTLPGGAIVAQASGGHTHPVFYVSDGMSRAWKWDDAGGIWKTIVPGGPPGKSAGAATRFFVDSFRPKFIYIVDTSGVKISLDGGDSWLLDLALTKAVTASGKIRLTPTAIKDILFLRDEVTRFVFGDAGVFCSLNGVDWITLLDAIAVPGLPESGFFDPVSDPSDRALYVALHGRSILRIGGVPAWPLQPPPVFDLLEFAAVLVEA